MPAGAFASINKEKMKVLISVIILLLLSLNGFAQAVNDGFEQDFDNARMVFHRTDFEKASMLFDELIKQQNQHALSYAYASMIDLMLYRNPTENIEKAKALSKKTDAEHSFAMALCSFANGDLADCELNMKVYLSQYRNDKYGMHVLGFTQRDLGRPKEGLKTLTDLINQHPSYYPAYNHIGYAHLSLQQNESALRALEQFVEIDSLNPSAFDSLAEVFSAMEAYDMAIANLAKAVLLAPEFAYGWKHMGDIFVQSGEAELAIRAYEHAKQSASLYGPDFVISVDKKITALKSKP
jgi:tetratricopeptide (TPR) repeat protein